MAAQANKGISRSELVSMVEEMARDDTAKQAERLRAIDFLLEHGDEGEGNVEDVWDELFLVGEVEE